jgi:Endosomal/lysosomal potassium channel TMEM175
MPHKNVSQSAGVSRLSESSRVEAFSDGVFAIAPTLLVLERQPPHGLARVILRREARRTFSGHTLKVRLAYDNHPKSGRPSKRFAAVSPCSNEDRVRVAPCLACPDASDGTMEGFARDVAINLAKPIGIQINSSRQDQYGILWVAAPADRPTPIPPVEVVGRFGRSE